MLLLSFARTLVVPPSMGERLARCRRPELSADDVAYCRQVTRVWCVFFVANGAFSAWLAARGALETWTVYNGLVSYVLVGLLFVGEMVYRAWHFRRFEGGDVTDVFLRKVFPPSQHGDRRFHPAPLPADRGPPPGTPVAVDAGRTVHWTTFTADVARLSTVLDRREPGRWLLYTENTYAFAVALMAVWQSGGGRAGAQRASRDAGRAERRDARTRHG